MSGLLPLAGAVFAVAALVALCAGLGLSHSPQLPNTDAAIALATTLPGGFAAVNVAMDRQGRGALLSDASGRVAVVAAHGAHFVTRLVEPGWTVRKTDNNALALSDGEVSAILDPGQDTDAWVAAAQGICSSKTGQRV